MALVTVAASQTNVPVGTGEVFIKHLYIIPETLSPGAVTLKDGAVVTFVLFVGGASSVATLHPIPFVIETESMSGGWTVTTGANVRVIVVT